MIGKRKSKFLSRMIIFAMVFTLMAPMAAFAAEGDTTQLEADILVAQQLHDDAVEGTEVGEYAADSKATLQSAIDNAQAVVADPAATTQEVADAEAALALAVSTFEAGVVVEADLTTYTAALAAVEQADYTEASWTTYQVVVAANEVTVANTQEEVNTATGLITAAQADLVFAGLADLNAAKAAEASLTPADFVDYSAVTAALGLPETTNAEVVAKTIAITDAIDDLVLDVNKTVLTDAITVANTTHTNASEGREVGQYAYGSKVTFKSAIDAAQVVADSTVATQVEVDDAVTALAIAITTFEEAMVGKLVSVITIANVLLVGDYAFDLNVANNNYNLANFLRAARTAYIIDEEFAIYYSVSDGNGGVVWYNLTLNPQMNAPVNANDVNINGLFKDINVQPPLFQPI